MGHKPKSNSALSCGGHIMGLAPSHPLNMDASVCVLLEIMMCNINVYINLNECVNVFEILGHPGTDPATSRMQAHLLLFFTSDITLFVLH